jgi:hypothetical protein
MRFSLQSPLRRDKPNGTKLGLDLKKPSLA